MARKLRVTAEEQKFLNNNQKNVAKIVEEILVSSRLTKSQFAETCEVSMGTITNIFRPNFNRVPSIDVIKKIALVTNDPETYYKKLIKAAGYDISLYPLKKEGDSTKEKAIEFDEHCNLLVNIWIDNLHIKAARQMPETLNKRKFDFTYKITDTPTFKTWNMRTGFAMTASVGAINDFFASIMLDGVSSTTKYSLITNSKDMLEELQSYDLSNLNTFISVIWIDGNEINEFYLETALDYSNIEFYNDTDQ